MREGGGGREGGKGGEGVSDPISWLYKLCDCIMLYYISYLCCLQLRATSSRTLPAGKAGMCLGQCAVSLADSFTLSRTSHSSTASEDMVTPYEKYPTLSNPHLSLRIVYTQDCIISASPSVDSTLCPSCLRLKHCLSSLVYKTLYWRIK